MPNQLHADLKQTRTLTAVAIGAITLSLFAQGCAWILWSNNTSPVAATMISGALVLIYAACLSAACTTSSRTSTKPWSRWILAVFLALFAATLLYRLAGFDLQASTAQRWLLHASFLGAQFFALVVLSRQLLQPNDKRWGLLLLHAGMWLLPFSIMESVDIETMDPDFAPASPVFFAIRYFIAGLLFAAMCWVIFRSTWWVRGYPLGSR
ncbi:MAG: hypothetical protein H6815_04035 [Phycisphaeraceae bacterium]|nr:hypothetical protein [Phycisphaerales bacterium]MCB9859600.1 hypothetical protein [Phycisphaeraceae bacterium]